MDFCVHINECFLTENMYLRVLQLKCFIVQRQSSGRFYGPPGIHVHCILLYNTNYRTKINEQLNMTQTSSWRRCVLVRAVVVVSRRWHSADAGHHTVPLHVVDATSPSPSFDDATASSPASHHACVPRSTAGPPCHRSLQHSTATEVANWSATDAVLLMCGTNQLPKTTDFSSLLSFIRRIDIWIFLAICTIKFCSHSVFLFILMFFFFGQL